MMTAILRFFLTLTPALIILVGYHYNDVDLAFGIVIGWSAFRGYLAYQYEKAQDELFKAFEVKIEGRNNNQESEDRDRES